MARFQTPPNDVVQVSMTRRRVVFIFIGLVVLIGAAFLMGLMVGRGQRHIETQWTESSPPPVITEPEPAWAPPIVAEPETSTVAEEEKEQEVVPIEPPQSAGPTPTVEPTPAPPPKPVEAQTGAYVVQVMATRDGDKAHRLVQRLKDAGLPAFSERTPRGLFRIRVGPFATRAEAAAVVPKVVKVVPGVKPLVQRKS